MLESVRDVCRLSCMCWRHLRPQAVGGYAGCSMASCNVKFHYLSLIGTHHVTISAGINYRSQSGPSRQLLDARRYVCPQHGWYSSGWYIRSEAQDLIRMAVTPLTVVILTVLFVTRNCIKFKLNWRHSHFTL